jgi:predicted nucleic acid-binding Zn ribbon protein
MLTYPVALSLAVVPTCEVCGKTFDPEPKASSITCSKECRDKWRKRLRQREFRTYDLECEKAEREAQGG